DIDTVIDDEASASVCESLDEHGADVGVATIPQKNAPQPAVDPESIDPEAAFDPSDREGRWARGRDWHVVHWIVAVHVGALAAPFFFTWQALVLCLFLAWFTGSVGVCMGYHRHLTHGSFATYKPIHWLLALIGGWSGEGSAIQWVANHRKHHAHSDQD